MLRLTNFTVRHSLKAHFFNFNETFETTNLEIAYPYNCRSWKISMLTPVPSTYNHDPVVLPYTHVF